MANIGLNLIKGIWNGIGNAASWLWNKVSGFCSNLLSKIKGFFGISSPSREMAWVGDMLTQGLAGGIEDGAGAAISAAEDLNNGILGVMDGLAADMQNAVQTVPLTQAERSALFPAAWEAWVVPPSERSSPSSR